MKFPFISKKKETEETEEFQEATSCDAPECEGSSLDIKTCSTCGKSFCNEHIEKHECEDITEIKKVPELPDIVPGVEE